MRSKDTDSQKYTKYVFAEQYNNEDRNIRYNRLLKEFNQRCEIHIKELETQAANNLARDSALTNNAEQAVANFQRFKTLLETYKNTLDYLKDFMQTYNKGNQTPEYFSKMIHKKYINHEFLTEGGYPNTEFQIELLARVITAIDEPFNNENQQQLLLLKDVIPDSIPWKIFMGTLLVTLLLTSAAAMMVLFPPAGSALLIDLIVPAIYCLLTAFFASYIGGTAMLVSIGDQKYKDFIPEIPKRYNMFAPPSIEQSNDITPSANSDANSDSHSKTKK